MHLLTSEIVIRPVIFTVFKLHRSCEEGSLFREYGVTEQNVWLNNAYCLTQLDVYMIRFEQNTISNKRDEHFRENRTAI